MIRLFHVVLNSTLVSDETTFKVVSKISVVSVVNDEIFFTWCRNAGCVARLSKVLLKKDLEFFSAGITLL